jgi:hypothetical protein
MTKIIFLEMNDIDSWERAISKFRVVLEEVQTKLAGSLGFIHSPDKNKAGVKPKAKGVRRISLSHDDALNGKQTTRVM